MFYMNKILVSFRLDRDLLEFLEDYAGHRRMSLSQALRMAVLEFQRLNVDEATADRERRPEAKD